MLVTLKEAVDLECRCIPREPELYSDGRIGRYMSNYCIADRCMAWVWLRTKDNAGNDIPRDERRGSCGHNDKPG